MSALLTDRRALTLMGIATLTIMSNATIAPALPGIEARFADVADAAFLTRLLVTAPSLAVAVTAPFAGLAADRFGARRQLFLAVLLFALSGTAGYVIDDLHVLLASRFVLGLAVAFMMTANNALVGAAIPSETRGRFFGMQMAATSFGGFLFVAAGGWLADKGPNLPFLVYAVGFLMLPPVLLALAETRRGKTGSGTGSGTFHGARPTWLIAVGAVALMSGVQFVLLYTLPTQLPFFLAARGHDAPSTAGAVMASMPLAGGLASLAYPLVAARLGRAVAPAVGFSMITVGFVLLSAGGTLPLITLGAMIIGTGPGFIIPSVLAITLDVAPAHRRGFASGLVTTSLFLGQFLSPVVGQPLVAAFGFDATFRLAASAALAIGLLVAVLLPSAARARPAV